MRLYKILRSARHITVDGALLDVSTQVSNEIRWHGEHQVQFIGGIQVLQVCNTEYQELYQAVQAVSVPSP